MPAPDTLADRLSPVGRAFYAAAVIFFGAQQLIFGGFITRIMPPWPVGIPGGQAWPYVIGVLLVVAGTALFFPKTARHAGLGLATMVLLSAVLLALPTAAASTSWGAEWTKAGKAFALGGGALVVAAVVRPGSPATPWLLPAGRVCLVGFLLLGGIQHFIWARFVVKLVPGWMPAPMFWVYFAGVALIAGGLGLLLRPVARLAALLTALMIFLWVVLLHVPRVVADLQSANEATAVFEALAFSGIALLLARNFGGTKAPRQGA